MNIALSTLIILVYALPGLLYRKSYYSSEFSTNYKRTNFQNEIIGAIVPSIFIHSFFRYLILKYSFFDFDFNIIGFLVSGISDPSKVQLCFSNIGNYHAEIIEYLFAVILFSVILGYLTRKIVIELDLDIFFETLRFQNHWYYFFSGRYQNIQKGFRSHKKIELIVVDVLVKIEGENVLYKGFANAFFMSKEGGLDSIVIKYPSKKEFNSNIETSSVNNNLAVSSDEIEIDSTDGFVEIPSDYLILDYSQIININFSYFVEENQAVSDKSGR